MHVLEYSFIWISILERVTFRYFQYFNVFHEYVKIYIGIFHRRRTNLWIFLYYHDNEKINKLTIFLLIYDSMHAIIFFIFIFDILGKYYHCFSALLLSQYKSLNNLS